MIPSEAKAAVPTQIFPPAICGNTTDATGGWIAVPATEGDLLVIQEADTVSGTLVGALKTSAESNGANNVAMTFDDGNNFASVAANNIQAKSVDARKNLGYVQYIGTIGTGPSTVSACVLGRPKTTT